jgi:hypothetical protein
MPWEKHCFSLYKEEADGTQKTKYQIGIEKCCENESLPGEKVCRHHVSRIPDRKYQAASTTDHGFLGGPYTSNSKLYGSQFYLDLIKKGWKIREQDELRAKEAIQNALSNTMPPKKTKAPADATTAETKPKAPRKITLKKKPVEAETIPAVAPSTEPTQFVEKMTAPIIVSETITVKVRKMKIEGKEYYVASSTGKVYAVAKDGVGDYKGRYVEPQDEESAKLNTEYPDSDVEVD